MREGYPEVAFPMEPTEPGAEPARVSGQPGAKLNRGFIFVKLLLAIPHYIVLFFLFIAVYVVAIIAFFAVIITGAWPEGMRTFVVGVMRWSSRVNMYVLLMTDQYPPFSLT